jgi:hypothetical protein
VTSCSLRSQRNLDAQGFPRIADDAETAALARAARFQPRATLALLVAGVALVASGTVSTTFGGAWFGVLAALGWLGVAFPAANVFDLVWKLSGAPGLGPPPAPRRFSQAIASVFLTTIAALFFASAGTAAFVVSGIMAFAATLAGFADFCVGSALYNIVRGRSHRAAT